MQYKRFMGLDYGNARIGIAFSDLTCTIASADSVYKSKGFEEDVKYLSELASSKQVEWIVLGLPLNADGTESEMSEKVKEFGKALSEKSQKEVFNQDERYTSFEAEEYLKEAHIKWEKRKELIDKVSAQIILQNYLDENNKRG